MINMTATMVVADGEAVSMNDLKDFVSQVDNGSAALNDADVAVSIVTDPDSEEPALHAVWSV